jgi:hypothetical protein
VAKNSKTVRFDQLVKQSGQPEQVTLWTKPEDDRDFMKAVHAGRVVTVLQQNVGTKKDFGIVGFFPKKNAAFLVFPKTLEPDDDTKVIGIKYERVAPESPKGPIFKPKKKTAPGIPMRERPSSTLASSDTDEPQRAAKPAPKPAPPREKFIATVQLVATQTVTIETEAANKTEATKSLKARAAKLQLDPAQATLNHSIKSIKKTRPT